MSSSSTTTKTLRTPTAPGDSAGYDRFIDRQVERTGAQVKLFDLCSSLMVLGAGVLSFLLIVTVLDHWVVPLGAAGRWAALVLLAGGSACYLVLVVLPMLLGRVKPLVPARTLAQSDPSLKNSLINFLLFRSDRAGVRAVVYQALEQRAAADLNHVPIDTAVDRSRLIRIGYLLSGVLAICAAYTILAPKSPFQSISRVLAPWADVARPSRVRIEDVQPGNVEVFQGQWIVVAADCYDLRRDEPVTVRYTTQDEQLGLQSAKMQPTAGLLRHECRLPADAQGVQRDLTYWIEAGDARTAAYQVRVVPAPVILVEAIEYEPPAYTRLPKRVVERQGDIKAAEGTRVTVRARANQPIAAAVLEFDPPPEVAGQPASVSNWSLTQGALASSPHWVEMEFGGQEAWCSFVCQLNDQRLEPKHRSYQLRFATSGGQRNPQPVLHRIDVLRDLPPEIEILTPVQDRVEVAEDGWQKIEVRAVDPDYGLTTIRLRATAGPRQVLARDLLQDPAGRQGQEIATFDFAPRAVGLRAGSEAKCWAVAEDNRAAPITGSPEPNVVKSREITLIVTRPATSPAPDEGGDQKEEPAAAKSGASSKPDSQGGQSDAAPPDGNSQPSAPSEPTPEAGSQQQGGDAKQPSGGASDSSSTPQGSDSSQTPQAGGAGKNADSSSSQGGSDSPPSGGNMTGGGNSADGSSAGSQRAGGGATGQAGDSGTQSGGPEGTDPSAGTDSGAGQPAEPLHDGEAFEKAMDHMQQAADRPGQDAAGSAGGGSQSKDQGGQKSPSGATPEDASQQGTSSDGGQQSKSPAGGQPQPAAGAGQSGEGTESESPKPDDSPSGAGSPQGATPKAAAGQPQPDRDQGGGQPQPGTPSPGGEQQGPMQQDNQAKQSPAGGGQKTEPGQSDGGQSGSGKANESRGGSGGGQNPEGTSQKQASSGGGEPRPNEEPQTPSMSRQTSGSEGDAGGDRSGSGKKGGGQGGNQPGQENPGGSSSADQGAGKSQESGSGDLAQRPGDKQQADGQTGQSGYEPGAGSQAKPATDGAAGAGKEGESSQNGPSTSPPKTPSGTAPSQGGKGLPQGGGNPSSAELQGGGQSGEVPDGEQPNLEYARKATDMVLEYLKDQQTNPDEDLLKKLGWTQQDLQDFVRRWSELKRTAREDERTQQELDDALRSLGLRPTARDPRRSEVREDPRRAARNLGGQSPPPPAYSEQFDAYRKGTARTSQPREAGSVVRGFPDPAPSVVRGSPNPAPSVVRGSPDPAPSVVRGSPNPAPSVVRGSPDPAPSRDR